MLSKASKLTSSLKLNQLCRSFSSGIESLVRTEIIDGIAVLRLSDPQRLNAMTVLASCFEICVLLSYHYILACL
jgi:hypothetical protein